MHIPRMTCNSKDRISETKKNIKAHNLTLPCNHVSRGEFPPTSETLGITLLKTFIGAKIFSHRHYYNIYVVERPIHLTASGSEFPFLGQHF